jgi:DNA-binding IclR family transcriptional regulator
MKTIQMVEILRETPEGLRVQDLRGMTGYPPSTIYRILRTLMAYKYAFRDDGGRYRLNGNVVMAVDERVRVAAAVKLA